MSQEMRRGGVTSKKRENKGGGQILGPQIQLPNADKSKKGGSKIHLAARIFNHQKPTGAATSRQKDNSLSKGEKQPSQKKICKQGKYCTKRGGTGLTLRKRALCKSKPGAKPLSGTRDRPVRLGGTIW